MEELPFCVVETRITSTPSAARLLSRFEERNLFKIFSYSNWVVIACKVSFWKGGSKSGTKSFQFSYPNRRTKAETFKRLGKVIYGRSDGDDHRMFTFLLPSFKTRSKIPFPTANIQARRKEVDRLFQESKHMKNHRRLNNWRVYPFDLYLICLFMWFRWNNSFSMPCWCLTKSLVSLWAFSFEAGMKAIGLGTLMIVLKVQQACFN